MIERACLPCLEYEKHGTGKCRGNSDSVRTTVVRGIIGALAVTRFFVISQLVADVVADVLCASFYGRSASKIDVSTDCRDLEGLLSLVGSIEDVIVVRNVIDPVNEGVLFSILALTDAPIVIFSFVSHPSVRLVAKEAWESMFFPSVEPLACCTRDRNSDRLVCCEEHPCIPVVSVEDAVDAAADLRFGIEQMLTAGGIL